MKSLLRLLSMNILFISFCLSIVNAQPKKGPLKLAVAGLTHGHVHWILGKKDTADFKMAAIYETNRELSRKYAAQYHIDTNIIYTDLKKMLLEVKPDAVAAFASPYEHLEVVEACAPLGIHVMVEKPLATKNEHAAKMQSLAAKHNIYLITNFETSWYPTTIKTFSLVHDSNAIGSIKKVVVHSGHKGPQEIGVNKEFFEWLTDPELNGGGALIDFGCYGANLMTYLLKGAEPVSVTAVTKQYKPHIYPKVDDEATIIVDYPGAQCIIQASWNWPFNRKDMEVYGQTGYVIAENNTDMRTKFNDKQEENTFKVTKEETGVYEDPFAYFAGVIQGKIEMPSYGVYSLENNITVVKILDAARESAKSGKTVYLKK